MGGKKPPPLNKLVLTKKKTEKVMPFKQLKHTHAITF